MAAPQYKEYTPEEDRIYHEAMAKIREAMGNGLNFSEACDAVRVDDPELKGYIVDDALKVMIAERHYGKGMPLPEVAETLKVPLKKIMTAHREMLEDVGETSAELYRQHSSEGPAGGPVGTA